MTLEATSVDPLYSQIQSTFTVDIESKREEMIDGFLKQDPSLSRYREKFMEAIRKCSEINERRSKDLEDSIDKTNFRRDMIKRGESFVFEALENTIKSIKKSKKFFYWPTNNFLKLIIIALKDHQENLNQNRSIFKKFFRDFVTGNTAPYKKVFEESLRYINFEVEQQSGLSKKLVQQLCNLPARDLCSIYEDILNASIESKETTLDEKEKVEPQDGTVKGVLYAIKRRSETRGYLFGTMATDPTSESEMVSSIVQEKLNSSAAMGTEFGLDIKEEEIEYELIGNLLLELASKQGMLDFNLIHLAKKLEFKRQSERTGGWSEDALGSNSNIYSKIEKTTNHLNKLLVAQRKGKTHGGKRCRARKISSQNEIQKVRKRLEFLEKKKKNHPALQVSRDITEKELYDWVEKVESQYRAGEDLTEIIGKRLMGDVYDPILEKQNDEIAKNIDACLKAAEKIKPLQTVFFAVDVIFLFATKGNPQTLRSILNIKGWKIELIKQQ